MLVQRIVDGQLELLEGLCLLLAGKDNVVKETATRWQDALVTVDYEAA